MKFLDDFSCFSWIYPLKTKNEALPVFKQFKLMAEKLLDMPIKTLHTDFGGEFITFTPFLREQGITHIFTYPYTSQQNEKVERKHRQIVDSRLTLLTQAKMPVNFWWEAFHTTVCNINCFPYSPLHNKTSLEVLFNKIPDYNSLHPFGCLAFPCLTSYNSHKLQFHSQKCQFIGYSNNHKEFKVLSSRGRIYLSRHVVFHHTELPYLSLFSTSQKDSNPSPMQNSQFILPILQSAEGQRIDNYGSNAANHSMISVHSSDPPHFS